MSVEELLTSLLNVVSLPLESVVTLSTFVSFPSPSYVKVSFTELPSEEVTVVVVCFSVTLSSESFVTVVSVTFPSESVSFV